MLLLVDVYLYVVRNLNSGINLEVCNNCIGKYTVYVPTVLETNLFYNIPCNV